MKSFSSTRVGLIAAIALLSLAACSNPAATNDAANASANSVTDAAPASAQEMHNQMSDGEDRPAADPAMSGMNKGGMGHMDGMGKMGNMADPQAKGPPKDAPMPMAGDDGAEGM